ncbi:MAG: hypothetical protein EOO75_08860 [Myxococcales bacterium]|nr:MAG: hypothetical protein EOO75_08860 [Myxococcales bacterium]
MLLVGGGGCDDSSGGAAPACSCSTPPPPPTEACDQRCADGVALRAMRETLKLAFNLALQGKPVGPQDATGACPEGGTFRVVGEATSNALQGTTTVKLTYTFEGCVYRQIDDEVDENYRMSVTGTLTQEGTIAVQPSATTALLIRSDDLTLDGEVYVPAQDYRIEQCPTVLSQTGNAIAGTVCGRAAGFDF